MFLAGFLLGLVVGYIITAFYVSFRLKRNVSSKKENNRNFS